MRKQYYFRPSDRGLLAWDVDRLVELSSGFLPKDVLLQAVHSPDETWTEEDERLMEEADLSFPIILSASGEVMDGRHRIEKALRLGLQSISAVQFDADPEPDYIGVQPDDLPYD